MAARSTLTLYLMLLSFLFILDGNDVAYATATATSPASGFIRTSCRATTYPAVCVQSLSTYSSSIRRSPRQLVMTALSVSVDRARSTKSFVSKLTRFRGLKPRERAAVKDCLEEVSDSVDRLTKSVGELKTLRSSRSPEFRWHMSNLQTWVSAALTDDSTCMDGFSGRILNGRIKHSIRSRMTNVAQVTSNALALCNKFAGKY